MTRLMSSLRVVMMNLMVKSHTSKIRCNSGRRLSVCLLALLLSAGLTVAVRADYIHGYFRYTVEDESVTITAYTGHETVVTVPAMIAGCPVNAIAPGAFSGSGAAEIRLPDTVLRVEDGAFGTGQNVVFESGSGSWSEISGIPDGNGGLITADDEGNLIHVDPDGNETVLDDSQDYTRETDPSGDTVIRSESGTEVSLTESGEASFTDAAGTKKVYSPDSGYLQETGRDGDYEEVDADAVNPQGIGSPNAEQEASAEPESNASRTGHTLPIVLTLSVAGIIIAAVLIARHKKKK